MRIHVSELKGLALDWAVAKGRSKTVGGRYLIAAARAGSYRPSIDWAQGGPLIGSEDIDVAVSEHYKQAGDSRHKYVAANQQGMMVTGPSRLVAGMRCFVAIKLGDEVDVPDEVAAT